MLSTIALFTVTPTSDHRLLALARQLDTLVAPQEQSLHFLLRQYGELATLGDGGMTRLLKAMLDEALLTYMESLDKPKRVRHKVGVVLAAPMTASVSHEPREPIDSSFIPVSGRAQRVTRATEPVTRQT